MGRGSALLFLLVASLPAAGVDGEISRLHHAIDDARRELEEGGQRTIERVAQTGLRDVDARGDLVVVSVPVRVMGRVHGVLQVGWLPSVATENVPFLERVAGFLAASLRLGTEADAAVARSATS